MYASFSSSVVFSMTPTQAQELRTLATSGTIDLVLRNPHDKSVINAGAVTPADVAKTFGYP